MSRARVVRRVFTFPGLFLLIALGAVLTAFYPYKATPDRPKFYGESNVLQLDLQSETLSTLIGGKKTLIFYFLPSCPHCQESTPSVVKLAQKYGSQIQFLGVASGRSRLSDVREFKEQHGLPFEVVQDTAATFGPRNGLSSYPAFILTDGKPVQAETYTGFTPDMEALLEVAIVRYLGKDATKLLDPNRYYGSQLCSTCHVEEFVSWGTNHHSVAMQSIIRTNKTNDSKCVSCHVVGLGEKTGFKDLESTPWLGNVGCEACHGAAGGHNKKMTPEEKAARSKMTVEQKYGATCMKCHDASHTIGFDLKKGIPLVGHHKDRTLSEVDWMARRTALLNGEAEKPLLEFPPGEIQGAQACVGCHADMHRDWSGGKHAQAMNSLKKAGKDQDVSCVKCHAILKDKSRTEAVDAYLPGVQCESCHGPGEAHVKAGGGKGNIVALNKSCPVCVIEAMCTSCHTSNQDPDFELDSALAKIKREH